MRKTTAQARISTRMLQGNAHVVAADLDPAGLHCVAEGATVAQGISKHGCASNSSQAQQPEVQPPPKRQHLLDLDLPASRWQDGRHHIVACEVAQHGNP